MPAVISDTSSHYFPGVLAEVVLLSPAQLQIVKYCAEEVERQGDGPIAVEWMLRAWNQALAWVASNVAVTVDRIEQLGRLVEPDQNPHGFRRVAVRVGPHLCPPWQDVPSLMERFVARLGALEPKMVDPAMTYKYFEEIHPFSNGNGRVGKILFNWLLGMLHEPQMPPNFFDCANP